MQAEALWQHCIEKLTLPGRLGWGTGCFARQTHLSEVGT
jgi:hypothetical protein